MRTIAGEPVDRIPVDIWLTPEVLDSLKAHTGEEAEYDVYCKLDLDKIAWVSPEYDFADGIESNGIYRDPWGVSAKLVQSGAATYLEFTDSPLGEMEEPEELEDYPKWPVPERFMLENAVKQAKLSRQYGFATMGPWISHFEIYCRMRGLENALMDVVAEPEFLEAGIERIDSIQTEMLKRFLKELGDDLDIVLVSDDMGTQESQLMSIQHWRQHFKPRMKAWCDLIHAHGKKVMFHSDGAARPFIPDLIECGIDILNPIQHVCPGMDRISLKQEFGDRITFHGGIENQKVLPYGSVEDVREEVITCLQTLGADGGYIPCSCHNIQPGTPPENVITMIETVQGWNA